MNQYYVEYLLFFSLWLTVPRLAWIALYLYLLPSLILYVIGWQGLTDKQIDLYNSIDRKVIVFTHSTTFDYPIMLTYQLCNPSLSRGFYVLMKPQMFTHFGWLWSILGCISSTRVEDKDGKTTSKVINLLKDKTVFSLMISPKGKVKMGDWRTGYYHLARSLKVPIMVVGLDYHHHRAVFVPELIEASKLSLEETKTKILEKFSPITVMYPENEYVSQDKGLQTSIVVWKGFQARLWLFIVITALFMWTV